MVEETGRTPADVTVMGVGDQGVWALDDLLDDGISWVDYVSFHIEERPLRSKRVPTRLFRRGEWRSAMEIWASPLSVMAKGGEKRKTPAPHLRGRPLAHGSCFVVFLSAKGQGFPFTPLFSSIPAGYSQIPAGTSD